MATKRAAARVVWTGKNLAAVKKIHRHVAHHPEKAREAPYFRDWTQHPDNLHITTDEGHTVVAEIGDALVRSADGRISVEKARRPRAQRALRPPAPRTGTVYHA